MKLCRTARVPGYVSNDIPPLPTSIITAARKYFALACYEFPSITTLHKQRWESGQTSGSCEYMGIEMIDSSGVD